MKHKDYVAYPEQPLRRRLKLAYDWIPKDCGTLLDAGCAFGYGTRFFAERCTKAYGIDPNKDFIDIAQKRYPNIDFRCCGLEKTPFKDNTFDCIIVGDVLEHVRDEKKSLNELFRILKKGGLLFISTPHKGLFSFMDTDNYVYYTRKYAPGVYKKIYKFATGRDAVKVNVGYEDYHRHYSLSDYHALLKQSKFGSTYTTLKTFRSGLLLNPLKNNVELAAHTLLGKKVGSIIAKPFDVLATLDYNVPFGPLAYNIAILIQKN